MTDAKQRDLTAERWRTFTLAEQLGNVGSEVSRTLKWRSRIPEIAERAMARALELIDLTLDDPRQRTSVGRLRELCRCRGRPACCDLGLTFRMVAAPTADRLTARVACREILRGPFAANRLSLERT